MSQDYSKFLIKEYKHWLLNVHENQGNLGRCVIWCKRENALDLTDATEEEQHDFSLFSMRYEKPQKLVLIPTGLTMLF